MSRVSDYIIYSVEAAVIDRVVAEYGPCMSANQDVFIVSDSWKATKVGAIVGGQTSCKAPELDAFDKHLPEDVEVVSCHSLHGPKVSPKGQPLVRYLCSQVRSGITAI